MKLPKPVAVCALGAVAVWGFLALRTADADRPRASSSATAAASSDSNESEHLRAELTRMQLSLARAEQRLAELEAKPSANKAAAADEARDPETSPKTPEQTEDERQAFVAQRFEDEERDPTWRPEASLRALVQTAFKPGDAVRAIDCKKSLCRLETVHASEDSRQTLVQTLTIPRPDQPPLFGGALFAAAEPSGNGRELRSITYLLRPGYDMPGPTP